MVRRAKVVGLSFLCACEVGLGRAERGKDKGFKVLLVEILSG